MTPNRKRGRDSQDDELPISKKVSNSHVSNNLLSDQQNQMGMSEWGQAQLLPTVNNLPDSPPLSVQSIEWNQATPALYNPELTEAQNPFYYNSNKLLYEMYVARLDRLERCSQ